MSVLSPVTASFGTNLVALDHRIESVRAGDAVALEALLVELLPFVRKKLLRLLGPTADHEDATQDALIELAESLPRFEGRSKLTTFAHRIVVRVAYRHYGKRRGFAEFDDSFADESSDSPEQTAIHREALARLHRVLAKLPEKRRVAFVLCEIEGMDPSEAAEVADTSALAMRTRLFHARSEVRRMLGVDDEGGAR